LLAVVSSLSPAGVDRNNAKSNPLGWPLIRHGEMAGSIANRMARLYVSCGKVVVGK
jgi:hypothetical protein